MLPFHPDEHLQLSAINTPRARSPLLGGHFYSHELFISLALNPVI